MELFHVEQTTPGQRLYLIRLACGDGVRKPESMRDFAERVRKATGQGYEHTTVSMLERDQQGWRLKDVHAFASVDPKGRGPTWLAFGESGAVAPPRADGELVAKPAPPRRAVVPATKQRKGAR